MRNTFLCITFVLFGLTLIDIKQFLLHPGLSFDEFAYRSSAYVHQNFPIIAADVEPQISILGDF